MENRVLSSQEMRKYGMERSSTRRMENGVSLVNWGLQWKSIMVGVLLTIALHLLIDLVMFGTPFPCKTTEVFADGSSVQVCEVRN